MPIELRDRTISFRLTKEEYDRFRELCYAHGMGSVSDMVRAGINMLLQQPARVSEEVLEARVTELEGRLRLLSGEVKKLTDERLLIGNQVKPRAIASAFLRASREA